jgi:hypothetical protein
MFYSLLDSLYHAWMSVSQYERPPGTDVVYELVAVLIIKPGALTSLDEKRRTSYCLEGAHRAVNAPGQIALGFFKETSGTVDIFHNFISDTIFTLTLTSLWRD